MNTLICFGLLFGALLRLHVKHLEVIIVDTTEKCLFECVSGPRNNTW